MAKVGIQERLRNALFLVPYVVRNRGVSIDELALRMGMTRRQLERELRMLLMVGRPPFTPDMMLEIYADEDRVYVDLDQSLDKPPALNAFEVVALAAAAGPYTDERRHGDAATAVRVALEKITRALPTELREWMERFSKQLAIVTEEGVDNYLSLLQRAIDEKLEVELQYYSASRDAVSERTVRPYGLVNRNGLWYLVAWCTLRQQVLVFRLTRILQVEVSERIFDTPQQPIDCQQFVAERLAIPELGENKYVIRFNPAAAPWARQRWPAGRLQETGDGSLELTLYDVSEEFVLSFVASYAGEASIVEPAALAARLAEEAAQVLQLYQSGS